MSVASVEPTYRHRYVGARGRMGRTTPPTRPRSVRRRSHPPGLAGGDPSTAVGLRLTRRGRFVVAVLAALAVAVMVAWGATRVSMAATSDSPSTVTVVVGVDDSLWSIAGDVAPLADRRELVARIIAINDLGDARIEPGQQLAIPVHG